jgi:hypothetical protein
MPERLATSYPGASDAPLDGPGTPIGRPAAAGPVPLDVIEAA